MGGTYQKEGQTVLLYLGPARADRFHRAKLGNTPGLGTRTQPRNLVPHPPSLTALDFGHLPKGMSYVVGQPDKPSPPLPCNAREPELSLPNWLASCREWKEFVSLVQLTLDDLIKGVFKPESRGPL